MQVPSALRVNPEAHLEHLLPWQAIQFLSFSSQAPEEVIWKPDLHLIHLLSLISSQLAMVQKPLLSVYGLIHLRQPSQLQISQPSITQSLPTCLKGQAQEIHFPYWQTQPGRRISQIPEAASTQSSEMHCTQTSLLSCLEQRAQSLSLITHFPWARWQPFTHLLQILRAQLLSSQYSIPQRPLLRFLKGQEQILQPVSSTLSQPGITQMPRSKRKGWLQSPQRPLELYLLHPTICLQHLPSCPTKYPWAQLLHLSATGLTHLPFWTLQFEEQIRHLPSQVSAQFSMMQRPWSSWQAGEQVLQPREPYSVQPSIWQAPLTRTKAGSQSWHFSRKYLRHPTLQRRQVFYLLRQNPESHFTHPYSFWTSQSGTSFKQLISLQSPAISSKPSSHLLQAPERLQEWQSGI